MSRSYWRALDTLVETSEVVIDRPHGSSHPRYSDFVYPLDYGYLAGTRSNDGDGIDVWVGSLPEKRVTALIMTIDLHKRDTEVKILLGCTIEEQQLLLKIHDQSDKGGLQSAWLEPRPEE